jgi:iron complex transport system substrate-binding protein
MPRVRTSRPADHAATCSRLALLGVVVGAFLGAGIACGRPDEPGAEPDGRPDPGPTAAEGPGGVRRVVSLDPSLTELVTALGAGERLVGRTRFCRVADPDAVPVVGDLRPVPEAVLGATPDLVLMADYPSQAADRAGLVALGAPVLALPLVTLADLRAALVTVGGRLGREAEARRRVDALDASLAGLSRCSLQNIKTFAIIHGLDGGHAYTTGGGDHVSALLEQAGLRNALSGHPPTARVGLEVVVAARPDLILHTAPAPAQPDSASAQRLWAAFPEVPAVRHGAVRVWPGDHLARNGPQLAEVADRLCAFLAGPP